MNLWNSSPTDCDQEPREVEGEGARGKRWCELLLWCCQHKFYDPTHCPNPLLKDDQLPATVSPSFLALIHCEWSPWCWRLLNTNAKKFLICWGTRFSTSEIYVHFTRLSSAGEILVFQGLTYFMPSTSATIVDFPICCQALDSNAGTDATMETWLLSMFRFNVRLPAAFFKSTSNGMMQRTSPIEPMQQVSPEVCHFPLRF